MLEDLTREDLRTAVDRAVEEAPPAAGILGPPVNAVAVAQHLGLTVRHDDRARRRRVKPDRENEIVLPLGLSAQETQSAVARALGAFRKPAILRSLDVPPEQQHGLMGASLTELFAEHLLLPTAWFSAAARTLDFDVPELQRLFATAGHEVVARRLLDLTEPCVLAIVDGDTIVFRRSNALRVNRSLSPAEQECQRSIGRLGEPQIVREDGWTVHGWPVPGTGNRRVILRSVLDELSS